MIQTAKRRAYALTLALLSSLVLLSSNPTKAWSTPKLTNGLTPGHVLTPGADAYFVPAKGLELSDKFVGFSSLERGIQVIVANINEPYATILETFTDSALKERGVDVRSWNELTINGAGALLIKALHQDSGTKWAKWIMLLDCGPRTLVVNGVFASGDAEAAKDVELMVKSVFVQGDLSTSSDVGGGVR